MTKTLSVAAIQNGTVIDHIPAGQAIRIIHLLGLLHKQHKVTLGLNLPSKRMKYKDIIKIEDHVLLNDQANEITIFAPQATINVIRQYEVAEKINTSLPEQISNVFICPNHTCITHTEPVTSLFKITAQGDQVKLICHFCEKTTDRNQAKVRI